MVMAVMVVTGGEGGSEGQWGRSQGGVEMGKGEEGLEGGGSWMTPRCQSAHLSVGVRWECWEGAGSGGGTFMSLSQEPLGHPRGGIKWEVEGRTNLRVTHLQQITLEKV